MSSNDPRQAATTPADGMPVPAEHHYRLLVENSTDMLCLMALNGKFVYLSQACREVLGFEPDELINRNKSELVHKDDRKLMLAAINTNEEAATTSDFSNNGRHLAEYRMIRKDGRAIWTQTTSRLIEPGPGSPRVIIAVIRDIDRHKQTETNLRHSERLASIGTFAAGIAHEINNPLGAILMAAHAATQYHRTHGNESAVSDMLEQITHDTRRAAGIVKSVLQFARQEQTERMPVQLRDIVLHARHHTLRYAGKKGLDIKVRGPDLSPWVRVGVIELEQALVNLFANAIESGATRINANVRVDESQQRVSVAVIDNGRGMSSQQVQKAFDPFYTSRAHDGGSGLGLSITQGIILAHEGTIGIQSAPDSGTTITFDLPMIPPPKESVAHA